MVLKDTVSELDRFVWILNHVSRSITWSLLTLSQMTTLNKFVKFNDGFSCRLQLIDIQSVGSRIYNKEKIAHVTTKRLEA